MPPFTPFLPVVHVLLILPFQWPKDPGVSCPYMGPPYSSSILQKCLSSATRWCSIQVEIRVVTYGGRVEATVGMKAPEACILGPLMLSQNSFYWGPSHSSKLVFLHVLIWSLLLGFRELICGTIDPGSLPLPLFALCEWSPR